MHGDGSSRGIEAVRTQHASAAVMIHRSDTSALNHKTTCQVKMHENETGIQMAKEGKWERTVWTLHCQEHCASWSVHPMPSRLTAPSRSIKARIAKDTLVHDNRRSSYTSDRQPDSV